MSNVRIEPTAEQAAAIGSRAESIVLNAAAGSGKTATLVERYLRFVEQEGLSPENILTVTFTRNAAAEMRLRIFRALQAAGLQHEAQLAETGPINTIDGLCERLLRENSLEAGIDPLFDISDNSEKHELLTEALRFSLGSEVALDADVALFLSRRGGQRVRGQVGSYQTVRDEVDTAVTVMRASGRTFAWFLQQYGSADSILSHWRTVVLQHCDDSVRAMLGEEWTWQDLHAAFGANKLRPAHTLPQKGSLPEDDFAAARTTAGLCKLALATWERFEALMARRQRYDFAEVQSRVIALVEGSEAVRARLERNYSVMLVDEAQDVNPLQSRLLDALGIPNQFFVGDLQQSIFGFRQAAPETFQERASRSEIFRLSKNRRSSESILRFVDRVFRRLQPETYEAFLDPEPMDIDSEGAPEYPGVEVWGSKRFDADFVANAIASMVREGTSPRDIAVLVRGGKAPTAIKQALEVRGIGSHFHGETAEFFARIEVQDVANLMRALAQDDRLALVSVLRSPFAGLSLDTAAELGKHPAPYAALREFQPSVAEDLEPLRRFAGWFLPLREIAGEFSAWEVLSDVLARSGYYEALARGVNPIQTVANVRQLFELSASMPECGPLELAEHVREITAIKHKRSDPLLQDPDDPSVTIMTIHRSKGLEFDTVVVPQTDWPMAWRIQDFEHRADLPMLVHAPGGAIKSGFHIWLANFRKAKDREEELRLTYVALTRAKERLCLCAHPLSKGDRVSKAVANALGWTGSRAPDGIAIRLQDAEDA